MYNEYNSLTSRHKIIPDRFNSIKSHNHFLKKKDLNYKPSLMIALNILKKLSKNITDFLKN